MSRPRPDLAPVRAARALLLAAALVATTGGVATADELWRRASLTSADRAYLAAMRLADRHAMRAAELSIDAQQMRMLREHQGQVRGQAMRAVDAYEAAIAAIGDTAPRRAAEAHFRAAEVLYTHYVADENHPLEPPTVRALRHWEAFERLAPLDPRLTEVYFRRSLTHTKLGGDDNLRKAIVDYELQLSLLDVAGVPAEFIATISANKAELHMGVGQLDEAIRLYSAAAQVSSPSQALHASGLAVALDRDGQEVKAREVMRDALELDPDQKHMRDPNVFFVPEGDAFYYRALAAEAAGELQTAANYYRRFLRELPDSPYGDRARSNLRRIEGKPDPRRGAASPRRGR